MTRRRTSPGTVLLIALAALLVLLGVVFRQGLASVLWRALSPVVAARNALNDGEVAQLQAQLASTTAALADHDLLAAENVQLRAQLGRHSNRQVVLAGVLQRPPGVPYDTLLVDAGEAQGVVAGARVFAGALVVGTVDTVYANTARVVLYSSPGQSYQAVLNAHGGTLPVEVEGQGSGSLQAQVPSGTDVRTGDTITFPGLDGGLGGEVSAVLGTESNTFKTIYLRLPVNISQLQHVYIQK